MSERWHRWALVGLSGLAYTLRVPGLGFQSLWRDEVDTIRFASGPLAELWRSFLTPGQNGPLYHLLLSPWLDLAGQSEFALRFFSAVLGVVAVPLIHRVAWRLFPELPSLALAAALLAATSPYLVWYGQEGKMYSLVVALALFSMERYLAAVERGGWQRWLSYVLGTSSLFYVHLAAVLLVPAQAVAFPLLRRRDQARRWLPWLAGMAALVMLYLPLLNWQVPLLRESGQSGYRFVPLPEMLFSLLADYSLGVMPGGALWTLPLFGGLLLAAWLGWKVLRRQLRPVGVLAIWLVVPVIGFFVVTLARPLYTARYLSLVLPAYLLLLAAGLVAVGQRSRLLGGLLLAGLLVANGRGMWLQATTPLKADFRGATAYLAARLAPGDLVLFQIPYGRHSVAYYWPRRPAATPAWGGIRVFLPGVSGWGGGSRWADGLYTNAGLQPAAAAERMAAITAGRRVVWLVASETALWDERGLVQAWLEDQAVRVDETRFVGVTVFRYELR